MTPQQIKEEVEKEFNKLVLDKDFIDKESDDDFQRVLELKAQLSILTEYDKSIKEMIEGFKEDIAHILEVTSTEVYQEFANNEGVAKYIIKLKKDLHKNNNSKINELLSKIGDNSEVEK